MRNDKRSALIVREKLLECSNVCGCYDNKSELHRLTQSTNKNTSYVMELV